MEEKWSNQKKNEEIKEIRRDLTFKMCTIGLEKDVLEVQVQEAAKREERKKMRQTFSGCNF